MADVDLSVGFGVCHMKELYVYNEKFGSEDNEIGKVLFCHPQNTNHDKQLKQVGFCQAVIQFSESFSTSSACESLHTQKARYEFYQPEPDYWFVMILGVPSVIKSSSEGIQVTDYHDDGVQDSVFSACLRRMYQRFAIRYGRLQQILETQGIEKLRDTLQKFIGRCLQKWEPERAGICDILFGLKFFPMRRQMFLKVQCFVNHLMMSWPHVKHVVIVHNNQLAWCGVGQKDIQSLFDFIIREGIPPRFRLGGDGAGRSGLIQPCYSYLTLFDAYGAPSNKDEKEANFFGTKYHMCIYKSQQTFVVMLVNADVTPEAIKGYEVRLEEYLRKHAVALGKDLAEESNATNSSSNRTSGPFSLSPGVGSFPVALMDGSSSSTGVKHLFYNNINLEERSSTDIRPTYGGSTDSYKLLADFKDDLSRMHDGGEIIAKMESDIWIVAKSSNKREFYAIINQKNNILEIDEEMKKLTDIHLSQIYFQD